MRLKELEIQGFKSFPDKTKIEIGEGITGVVGPNGSGKSNISDSIRWVLGETSSKQLRGSGKMEDVIFGGTQSRGAMGYASVALTIDNSDHGLDMDADEVTIGRRYYRSGESELAATAMPSSGRAALPRSSVQNPRSAAKFLRKRPASPSTATAKTRPSAAWTPPRAT